MEYKNLSDRKKKILNAVINTYIDTAEPVSSQGLKDKYIADVSSATIRSELSALEEMGYLVQPHTSAGRVPSAQAYQQYVENMLDGEALTIEELNMINSFYNTKFNEVEDLIKSTAKIISDITNYTSVIVVDNVEDVRIRSIKLVDIGDAKALIVIVTDSGVISDKIIDYESKTGDNLNTATSIVNNVFAGKTIGDARHLDPEIKNKVNAYKGLFEQILKIIADYSKKQEEKVYLEGEGKIFNHPEAQNLTDTKNFLSIITEKDKLRSIITEDNNIEFSIKIGKDQMNGVEHCALVTTTCVINGKTIGKAGVIGPERMNYSKVKSVLKHISKLFEQCIGDNKE